MVGLRRTGSPRRSGARRRRDARRARCPAARAVAASSLLALLLRRRTTTLPSVTDRSRCRLTRSWASSSVSATCSVSTNSRLGGLHLPLELALGDHRVQRVPELGELVAAPRRQDVGGTPGRDLRREPGVAADPGNELPDEDGDHGQAEDEDDDHADRELDGGRAVGRVGVLTGGVGERRFPGAHPLPALDDVGEDLVDLLGEPGAGGGVQSPVGDPSSGGERGAVQFEVGLQTLADPLQLGQRRLVAGVVRSQRHVRALEPGDEDLVQLRVDRRVHLRVVGGDLEQGGLVQCVAAETRSALCWTVRNRWSVSVVVPSCMRRRPSPATTATAITAGTSTPRMSRNFPPTPSRNRPTAPLGADVITGRDRHLVTGPETRDAEGLGFPARSPVPPGRTVAT